MPEPWLRKIFPATVFVETDLANGYKLLRQNKNLMTWMMTVQIYSNPITFVLHNLQLINTKTIEKKMVKLLMHN